MLYYSTKISSRSACVLYARLPTAHRLNAPPQQLFRNGLQTSLALCTICAASGGTGRPSGTRVFRALRIRRGQGDGLVTDPSRPSPRCWCVRSVGGIIVLILNIYISPPDIIASAMSWRRTDDRSCLFRTLYFENVRTSRFDDAIIWDGMTWPTCPHS